MQTSHAQVFGDLLRRYRMVAGLSQEALAERARMSVRGLIYLERGKRRPYPHTVRRLAEALALTAAERAALASAAGPRDLPAARSPAGQATHTLPLPSTPLIGRETDVRDVCALLQRTDIRLLTLTGPGGIGKTRLALQVAVSLPDLYPDGVLFVPLASLRDPALLDATLAQALGVRERPDQSICASLTAFLRDKQLLLLLDNMEHLLAAADLVAGLLAACGRLKVLVTSRAMLHVQGERTYAVPPLAWPDPERLPAIETIARYPAMVLFAQRAAAAKPDFQLTAATAPAIAAICARLDGLPLAIELAAARITLLPPQALLARLQGAYPAPPLHLLAGGARDQPERLRTMRNAIAWSHDLLAPRSRALFRRLAVFAGGCTLEAAEAVCRSGDDPVGVVLEGLADLVEQSLLRSEEQSDGEPRLLMLETIREYGLEQLTATGEMETLRRAHAAYYLDLVEHAEPELRGPSQAAWVPRLEREHDNLRAALQWARQQGDAEIGLRLASALWRFWERGGYLSEGRRWLEEWLARAADVSPAVRARALNGAGSLAWCQGEYTRAEELHLQSLALRRELGDRHGIGASLNNLGCVAWHRGRYAEATALLEESLAVRRELGDAWGIGSTLNNLGALAHEQGDYARATALYEESVRVYRSLGDRRFMAHALHNLGDATRSLGHLARAEGLLKESLILLRGIGDTYGLAYTLGFLAKVVHEQGDHARALAFYRESLGILTAVSDKRPIAECLEGMARIACVQGQPERAARLCGAAATVRAAIGAPLSPSEQPDHDRVIATVRSALGEEALAACFAAGEAMGLEQAVAYALRRP